MKPLYTTLTLLIGFVLSEAPLRAQTADSSAAPQDSTSPHKHKHSYFEAELNYQSNNVYLGRKDSSALHYITPMITYTHKSGLYFSASAAWLKNPTDSRIDVATLEGGYAFSAGVYSGDFTASKFFYSSESSSVTSGITASLSYQSDLDLGFIESVVGLTLDFGPHTDFGASFGLEHRFGLWDDKLEITPSFTANASTLNFYNSCHKSSGCWRWP